MEVFSILVLICLHIGVSTSQNLEPDENGYIMFCPCMGRFGNQADHYLGALGFAKGLNRTLVLPPWVEYRTGQPRSVQVPFKTYFSVEAVSEFHRVIPMEEFFNSGLADLIWPKDKRYSFCYANRQGDTEERGCNAKNGNPFGPFWDTFDVDFIGSVTYGPLHYDVHHTNVANDWMKKFPADEWPVLAFTGAPAPFPIQIENIGIQKHFQWNEEMNKKANEFIKESLPKGPFVGIHLRNGIDWTRACEYIPSSPLLFAAAQCLGYRNEFGVATAEMCKPQKQTIIRQVKRAVNKVKAVSIFVASDHDHMLEELQDAFKRSNVTVIKRLDSEDPHLALAILGRSNFFIGNCISSFSAFVKRERDVMGFPSTFWGFPPSKSNDYQSQKPHEEL